MEKVKSALNKLYNRCIDVLFHLSEFLVIVMMLVIVADVIMRYTTRTSIVWAFEFTEYALVYITFLGTAWLLRNNGHVRMDVLLNILKPPALAYVQIVASIILVITCTMLLFYGTTGTIDSIQNNVMSVKYYSMPRFILIIMIPISSFFLLIEAIKQVSNNFRQLKPHKD